MSAHPWRAWVSGAAGLQDVASTSRCLSVDPMESVGTPWGPSVLVWSEVEEYRSV